MHCTCMGIHSYACAVHTPSPTCTVCTCAEVTCIGRIGTGSTRAYSHMSQTSATCLEEATCLKLEEEAAVLHELAAFASLTVLCHAIYYQHVTSCHLSVTMQQAGNCMSGSRSGLRRVQQVSKHEGCMLHLAPCASCKHF
jgi:hypothetical protein